MYGCIVHDAYIYDVVIMCRCTYYIIYYVVANLYFIVYRNPQIAIYSHVIALLILKLNIYYHTGNTETYSIHQM